jgi:TAP-like protein
VHPVTGHRERIRVDREALAGMVRAALYLPVLAAALPQAIDEASDGRFAPLLGLATALSSPTLRLYAGMHFSVICAEDEPRRGGVAGAPSASGDPFGAGFAHLYERVCADWPRGAADPAFYDTPRAPAPVLMLSGGADPATPPRHASRIAGALGPRARHSVVAHGGHGLLGLPCLRETVYRFVDAESDDAALDLSIDCAHALPRPPAFAPIGVRAASGAAR